MSGHEWDVSKQLMAGHLPEGCMRNVHLDTVMHNKGSLCKLQ